MNPKQIDLSKIPYSQRQLIVVQEDEIVAAHRAAQKKQQPTISLDWQTLAVLAGKSVLDGSINIVSVGAALAKNAYEAWANARASGLNILQISNAEATQLALPPGHPRLGTLYVAHPTMPSVYYTTASFHRVVFEHKFAEAVELLMSLGASHISVEHVRGWSREFSAKMAATIPKVSAEATASTKTSYATSMLFKADFTNDKIPVLPSSLVWYAHEPTWQSIANGRLNYGMNEFSLGVNYQDDFGVNAGLKVKAEKVGLDMGGAFESHTDTTWTIAGRFNDKSTKITNG